MPQRSMKNNKGGSGHAALFLDVQLRLDVYLARRHKKKKLSQTRFDI